MPSTDHLTYGDEVQLPDRPERNPHTFMHNLHTGRVKLRDRCGYPVRIDPAAIMEAE